MTHADLIAELEAIAMEMQSPDEDTSLWALGERVAAVAARMREESE